MNSQTVLEKIKNYLLYIGEDVLLLVSTGLAVLIFAVIFLSGIFKRRSVKRLTAVYAVAGAGLALIVGAATLLCHGQMATQSVIFIPVFTLGVYTFLYIPVCLFCGKVRVKENHKKLIDALDYSIKPTEPKFLPKEIREYKNAPQRESVSMLVSTPEKQPKLEPDIDFTHVRNVIARLDYFGLSQPDKKVVGELSTSLNIAESSGLDEVLKSKINDGLGALLKIMSKYNV